MHGSRISARKMLFVFGMSFRIAAVVVAFSNYALAQFFSLATDADGSRLCFATPLRQKNTAQPTYGKLFRMDSSGLKLQESRIVQPPEPVPSTSPWWTGVESLQAIGFKYYPDKECRWLGISRRDASQVWPNTVCGVLARRALAHARGAAPTKFRPIPLDAEAICQLILIELLHKMQPT